MDVSRVAEEASRLLPLAERVLERYPFDVREVTHLATHSNVMYRVITRRGQQMVLRVGAAQGNTRSNIGYEVAWLTALARDTDLDVVRPIPASDGSLIIDQYDPLIDKERACVLFSWVPGSPLGSGAGPYGYRLLGEVSAALQTHGRTWQPPDVSEMRRWDRVFYYGWDVDPVIVSDPRYAHLFDAPTRRVLATAFSLSDEAIRSAWATGRPQVVHGDLHEWNVHLVRGRIHVFDFEDLMIALPAQDVAISLYHSRNQRHRDEARASFRRGYESVAPWPVADEAQLDAFLAARQVMLMNYAARALPPREAEDFLEAVVPWLAAFVDRYG